MTQSSDLHNSGRSAGRLVLGAYTRRRSSSSNNAASGAVDSRITPSLIPGHMNLAPSSRSQISTAGSGIDQHLHAAARLEGDTKNLPLKGCCRSTDYTVATRPSAAAAKVDRARCDQHAHPPLAVRRKGRESPSSSSTGAAPCRGRPAPAGQSRVLACQCRLNFPHFCRSKIPQFVDQPAG